MSTYGTPFTETELLLAVQSDDAETVARLLGDMLPGELRELEQAALRLSHVIWDWRGRPGALHPTAADPDTAAERVFRKRVDNIRVGTT